MPRYVGLDLARATVQVAIVDESGTQLRNYKLPLSRAQLERFIATTLRPDDEVAVEASGNTWAVVDLLAPHVARVVVSNPLRTRAIASAKVKTDRVDARVLAELLRCGYLPEVWQPDATTRHLRDLTHQRSGLVGHSTAIKNRIHGHLARRLVQVPCSDLFGSKGLAWLRRVSLDAAGRAAVDAQLRLLDAVKAEIERLDAELAQHAWRSREVRLLMTLPGVSQIVAISLLAAWGDITRFPSAEKASAYLGVVPSTRQTGVSCYHGPITKQGAARARWLLVQAAQHLDRHPGPLGHFFRRLSRKKNRNVAVVATARKLAVIAYHMLRSGEPYRYAQPTTTATKLAALRVAATGVRHRRGTLPGTPRPATYGSGIRIRTVPALADVCRTEELPEPTTVDTLPPGELRLLTRTRTLAYARSIQAPNPRPRTSSRHLKGKKAQHETPTTPSGHENPGHRS